MIALMIVLGILALIIGLLSIPVLLRVEYTGEVKLGVQWLFLRKQLVPAPDKPEKKKKEKPEKEKKPKEEKPKEEGEKKPGALARFYEYQGIPGFVELLRRTVAALKKFRHGLWLSFCIREFDLAINLPGSDPEALAVQYGKLSAAIFPPLGWLTSKLRTKKGRVRANIYPDFTGHSEREIACRAVVSIIPSVMICATLGLLARLGLRVGLKFLRGAKAPRETTQTKKQIEEN